MSTAPISEITAKDIIKDPFIPHKIQKYQDQSTDDPLFFKHKRHVFIFTPAGKPIFSRYGDEIKLSSFIASLSAIIEKFGMFISSDSSAASFSKLHSILSEKYLVLFLFRQKLIYVGVTKKRNDSIALMRSMLDFINIQVISVITNGVNKMLVVAQNYDPRTMLGGTNNSLLNCIKNSLNSSSTFLNAFQALPVAHSVRNQILNILKDNRHPDLLYSVLITPINVVSIYKSKNIDYHSQDILLLLNLIQSTAALRNSENWIPICLPGISADGFIYCYIYFFTKNLGIIMITSETSNDMFFTFSQLGKNIHRALKEFKIIDHINTSLNNLPYQIENTSVKNVRHFLIKSVTLGQYTQPKYNVFGRVQKEAKEVLDSFSTMYDQYQKYGIGKKEYYQITKTQNCYKVLFSNLEYIIMFTASQFEDFNGISNIIQSFKGWLKAEENMYFISKTLI